MVYRIFAEKKEGHNQSGDSLRSDLKRNLGIGGLQRVRIINRYDVEGISEQQMSAASNTIFSEPAVDHTYNELSLPEGAFVFATEYLPGQFDQRADSCAQCISLLTGDKRPTVKSAVVYIMYGDISKDEQEKIKSYIINPVESREASLKKPESLREEFSTPDSVKTMTGFINLDKSALSDFLKEYGFAMDEDDIAFLQSYFKDTERRDPTITELRMIDTYWSDHCRHTTFSTNIDNADIEPEYIKDTYSMYHDMRENVYGERAKKRPVTLMDIATMGMKYLKKNGHLSDLDESEEINACSVNITISEDGVPKDYLLMFKNETHNHPTEIEPFGGAATCLGGAIRDPLSGRAYVYQAMRITGSADPRKGVKETIKGKLPQRKLTTTAAAGFSAYGNQIGLATGLVNEIYHEGYAAKRLELGAVVGAAELRNVKREVPATGDAVILIGGRTGRDGCGGATGSSKSHTVESIETCGAEVQKGNPPEERKIQRLFRNPDFSILVKRCNDFGAGGVSVAVGELADGLDIDLDKVPKKYEGLDGTELAISESQERMAVVVDPKDVDFVISAALGENLEATVIAKVTDTNRLKMNFKGKTIVDISRDFLNSNGAEKHTDVKVESITVENLYKTQVPGKDLKEKWINTVSDLNICSQKGLAERFDSTIGASTVIMPFGGKNQLSPAQFMAAKLPLKGETEDCSVMAYGFDPYLSEKSPFHGSVCAIVEAVSKLVASGCSLDKMWLTLQEYFPRTQNDPKRWGLPFQALLGALYAQNCLKIAAIGGKDSMSGTFEDIDVPPTLTAFAVSHEKASRLVSNEYKGAGNRVYLIKCDYDSNGLPEFESFKKVSRKIYEYISKGVILSSFALKNGGICEAVTKLSLGNSIGFTFDGGFDLSTIFDKQFGSFILESSETLDEILVGVTTGEPAIIAGDTILNIKDLDSAWQNTLEKVFPVNLPESESEKNILPDIAFSERSSGAPAIKTAKPRVFIPVFPGTNCEYDTEKAFRRAGAEAKTVVIRNLTPKLIEQSVSEAENAIKNSQIIMVPGGFSAGDEPEGSGKFIATFFRNERIKYAVTELLGKRDGLMLGICNGFQALIKLGLFENGEINDTDENSPTLTFNRIGRHQSMIVRTKVSSVKSPWLAEVNTGDIHSIAISHGEGRFSANKEVLEKLIAGGQIATRYVDAQGNPTMDIRFNPNTSDFAVEGITSPDGRVFGKMGHSERIGDYVYKNVPGNFDQKIFESGVKYFK